MYEFPQGGIVFLHKIFYNETAIDCSSEGIILNSISKIRSGARRRVSSYDRSGGNKDYYTLAPHGKMNIAALEGAGYITHIWVTMAVADGCVEEPSLPRKVALRMFWNGEAAPSVEAPIGDFFGMGHGLTKNFSSAYLMMSPEDGKAFNCFFPMPFRDGARIEVENESGVELKFYFYIDYEQHEALPEDELFFHAAWRRECPTGGVSEGSMTNEEFEFGGQNVTGDGNYVILEAGGRGHYVGCNLNVHNLRHTPEWNWYGEGDDMIFIDGEAWPPNLHGTGTEDYFNTAWCPQQEYTAPYHGIILGGGPNWSGKVTLYRYHILDPIMFNENIRVTIEHGHNNHRSDDISSTAYWYQTGENPYYKPMPKVNQRLPLPDIRPQEGGIMKALFAHPNP